MCNVGGYDELMRLLDDDKPSRVVLLGGSAFDQHRRKGGDPTAGRITPERVAVLLFERKQASSGVCVLLLLFLLHVCDVARLQMRQSSWDRCSL